MHRLSRISMRYSDFYQCKCKSTTSVDYCLDLLKKSDYENFMCTLLIKNADARSAAIVIRAFNVELAHIVEQATQPQIGLMRLKFWEETVEKCFANDANRIPKHPVALELHKVIRERKLSKRYLRNLLKCRTENISNTMFASVEEMEKYAELSVSNVYYLLAEGSDVRNVHVDHAASHLGKAQGICQQLRTIPLAKKLNFIAIPQDVLVKHKVSQEDIFRGRSSDQLSECVFDVASRAHLHLVKARNLIANVPNNARGIFLPAAFVDFYLRRLQYVHHNVFDKTLQSRSFFWLPRLYLNSLRNIY